MQDSLPEKQSDIDRNHYFSEPSKVAQKTVSLPDEQWYID